MNEIDQTKERLVASMEDLREQLRGAETALRESEARYRQLLEHAPAGIFEIDFVHGKFADVNDVMCEYTGYSREEFLALPPLDILTGESRQLFVDRQARMLRGETVPENVEYRIRGKNEREFWVILNVRPIFSEGSPTGAFVVAHDITELKRAEKALRESEERYRILIESIPVGLYRNTPGPEGRFLMANPAIVQMFGYSDTETFLQSSVADLYWNPADRQEFSEKLIAQGRVVAEEEKLKRRDGTPFWGAVTATIARDQSGEIKYFDGMVEDITQRRRAEEALQRAEKLESISILAGGIAHDFNNLLTGILGSISLVKMNMTSEEKNYNILNEAENAAVRARALTQQLLTFARGGAPVKKKIPIAELVKEAVIFALRGSDVRCTFSIAADLCWVEVDEGQMGQVIHNLILNAHQAMPGGGVIRVKAENEVLREDSDLPLPAGRFVKITIDDHGIGIPAEHLQKIFDPFFTTKRKGSGLGLAVCHSIVVKHNGYISAQSRLREGSRFHIYLPALPPETSPAKLIEKELNLGKKKLLVMDDEEIVRFVVSEMLAHLGCEAVTAMDGREAVRLFRQAIEGSEPFDGVILDLTVPGGMGGEAALRELLEIDPHIKAIVSSGYSTDPIIAHYRQYGFSGYITKPYRVDALAKALNQVFECGRPAESLQDD